MKTSWETHVGGTTHYIQVNAFEVVVGSHGGSGHTDHAGAVLHGDFLQGQYHDLIRRDFGPEVLAGVIEAVHAAATHPPFIAQREHRARLQAFLDAIPLDPNLNALPGWPDTEHGGRNYGNAGGYNTTVHCDTLTLTTERDQALLTQTSSGGYECVVNQTDRGVNEEWYMACIHTRHLVRGQLACRGYPC